VEVGDQTGRRGPRERRLERTHPAELEVHEVLLGADSHGLGERVLQEHLPAACGRIRDGTLYLAFGTGERTAIGFKGVTDCTLGGSCTTSSASRQENNRYYVITDPDPLQGAATIPAAVTEADLTNISVVGTPVTSTRGYYFRTLDGEKFVTTSAIFAGKVIAASFTPSQLAPGDPGFDPCTQRGSGNLYKFNLKTGVGDFTDASNNESRYTSIGTGLPTDPKISIGVGGDDNKIVIQKSGTEIEVINTDSASFGRGIIYWRELR